MTPERIIRCEITQLELGLELEDASRYAETVAGQLEIVCEALEAIGLNRRAEVMRIWLARWLRVVDLIFEERLAQQSLLLPNTDVTRAPPETSITQAPLETNVTRALSDAESEKPN